MPDTLEVFDRWRSSTPSLSSPIVFEMCSKNGPPSRAARRRIKQQRQNAAEILNSAATSTGAWQGGDYQALLEGDGIVSCDSSIDAWSEDGHRDHIQSRKRSRDTRKRRASSIVNGTLIVRNTAESDPVISSSASLQQFPNTANSERFSAALASPLHKFPAIPARGTAGRLVTMSSPTTPRPFQTSSLNHMQRQSLLTRHISQDRGDNSPLDAVSEASPEWMVESEDVRPERASVLLDNLLNGVQKGFVDSPDEMSEEGSSMDGWETDDCEITPRLRPICQRDDNSSETSTIIRDQGSIDPSTQREGTRSDSSSISKTNERQRSFIRVPSAIFPHTPGLAQRQSIVAKRLSSLSTSSASSRTSKQYRRSRLSIVSSSLTGSESDSSKRSSVHLASAPRLVVRKSKYYSRPPQPGMMPHLKKQHLKGARGKFWSPMNSLYLEREEDDENPLAQIRARQQSSRYSRRSGQAWVRPRTFEVKDQYRVTIYPPQIEDCRVVLDNNAERTPTQAAFNAKHYQLESISSNRSTKGSSVRGTPPPRPAPTRTLPPLPTLRSASSNKARNRISKDGRSLMRMSQTTSTTTITTCSQCQQSSYSCSCSLMRSTDRTSSTSQSVSEIQTCSCTDLSTCSCTVTRSSTISTSTPRHLYYQEKGDLDKASKILGLPCSAPPYPFIEEEKGSVYITPQSAPYYTSAYPPVLDPIPRFSPLRVDFSHFFRGKRRSKRWTRSSIGTRSSVMTDSSSEATSSSNRCSTCTGYLTSSSRCSTCVDASELTYLCNDSSAGTASVSQPASYYTGTSNSRSSLSYSSSLSSSSSSSPMGDMDSDGGSENDSEPPLTPPRSEYQSTYGLSESPGYRMSFIVSPMPQSVNRYSQMQNLLSSSPTFEQEEKERQSPLSSARPYSQFTTSSSNMTTSVNGTSRIPRSILKTSSNYRECDHPIDKQRRPTVSMAEDTIFKSSSESVFSSSSSRSSLSKNGVVAPPKRSTLATSTVVKKDLEERIQKEEHRRRRNESRLYALEKLEGKTKKSSLFFSLMSSASTASTGSRSIQSWDLEDEEEEMASPVPQTPLTPAKQDLLELQREVENRQRITQFQNNKAVSFTDVIGFDMGTYPKIPSRKRSHSSSSASASEDQKDAILKHQLRTLSTAIEARQYAKDKFIDK